MIRADCLHRRRALRPMPYGSFADSNHTSTRQLEGKGKNKMGDDAHLRRKVFKAIEVLCIIFDGFFEIRDHLHVIHSGSTERSEARA